MPLALQPQDDDGTVSRLDDLPVGLSRRRTTRYLYRDVTFTERARVQDLGGARRVHVDCSNIPLLTAFPEKSILLKLTLQEHAQGYYCTCNTYLNAQGC
ncbi:hypothetical protein PGT21_003058 [Puccinia graminis f. sp. tritici]|uniref:Uncharacterized protein n=1 Tax=Puccinia graminis f. sp. tritici TaxID=56615 RepID=A0A5B0LMI2_PUCGR|nr:hypothetical protein PGT21_003058 [Puccinia graminis f. sp. tritici]